MYMLMFNEDIKARGTTYDINFLTVSDFQEIYFDVYELVINGNKYIAEKVSEYQGMPVVSIPVTINGIAEDASFVLKKGTQEVLFSKKNTLTHSDIPSADTDFLNSLNEDSISEISNLYIDREAINEELEKAKLSAAVYAKAIKEQKIEEATLAIERKKKDAKREIESYKKDLLNEFYGLTEDIRSSLHESNTAEQLVIRKNVSETLEILSEELDNRIEKASKGVTKFYDNKIKLIEESVLDITKNQRDNVIAIINESKQSLIDQINAITVPQTSVIVEKDGKSTLDLKELKSEIEKKITAKFSAEMGSLKRYIELSSGGGSVAQQFAAGGTMNGSLTVTGTISASQYLGIVTSTGNEVLIGGNSAGTNMLIGTNDNFNLNLETAGTTKMTVTNTGNVGIGNTAPSAKLQVGPSDSGNLTVAPGSGGSDGSAALRWSSDERVGFNSNAVQYGISDVSGGALRLGGGGNFGYIVGNSINRDILINPTTGNIGIGTVTPQTKLDVNGTGRVGGFLHMDRPGGLLTSFLAIGTRGAAEVGNFGNAAGNGQVEINAVNVSGLVIGTNNSPLILATAQAERLRITATGNVGIGTTTPRGPLDISSSNASGLWSYLQNTNSGNYSAFAVGNNISASRFVIYTLGSTYPSTGQYQANHTLMEAAGDLFFKANNHIFYSGNVGIGTTTPSSLLNIYGVNPKITLEGLTNSSPGLIFKNSAGSISIDANSARDLTINDNTSGTSRLVVRSNGLVGIGDYYGPSNYPQNKLSVNGSASVGYATSADVAAPSNGLIVNGSVGIGTTTPAAKVHIVGTNFLTSIVDAPLYPALHLYSNGVSIGYIGSGNITGANPIDLGIQTPSGSKLFLAAGSTAAALTVNAGKVGIGTSNPSTGLHVYSANVAVAIFDGPSNPLAVFSINNSQFASLGSAAGSITGGTVTDLAFQTSNNLVFATGGTALANIRMFVASTGNVGIGTTAPSYLLDVKKSGGTGVIIGSFGDTSNNSRISFRPYNASIELLIPGSYGTTLNFNIGGFSITDSGNSGNTFFACDTSGIRTKSITSAGFGALVYNQLRLTSNWYPSDDGINPAINFTTYNSAGSSDQLAKLQIYNGDSGKIILNPSGGNVGIGTTTPTEKLQINGAVRVSGDFATWATNTGALFYSGGKTGLMSSGPDTSTVGGFFLRGTTSTGAGNSFFAFSAEPTGCVGIGIATPANYTFSVNAAHFTDTTSGNWGRIGRVYMTGAGAGSYPDIGYNIRSTGGSYVFDTADSAAWITIDGNFRFKTGGSGAAGAAITATERLTILASTGNVGIGITNPDARLDVSYSHGINGGFIYGIKSIVSGGSNNQNVAAYFSAVGGSGQVALRTGTGGIDFNGTLSTTGNIFLGAVPSATKGNLQIGDATVSFAAGFGGLLTFSGDTQGQGDPARSIFALVRGIKENGTYQNSLGALIFGTQSASAATGLLSTVSEKMRISSSGNVGIGTATPNLGSRDATATYLTVYNAVADKGGVLELAGLNTSDGGAVGTIAFTQNGFSTSSSSSIFGYRDVSNGTLGLRFVAGGINRLTIDSSGRVGIGITSPLAKLQVIGNITVGSGNLGTPGIGLNVADGYNTVGFGAPGVWFMGIHGSTDNQSINITDANSSWPGTSRVTFLRSGNVGVGTTTPASKVTVTGGDVEITTANTGVIFKTPDGTKRYRMTIDNAGAPVFTLLP